MIEYRVAQSSDAKAIAALHARSWRENYRGSFRDEFLDGDLLGERLGVWSERLERAPANQLVQIAVDGESVVGFVCAFAAHDPRWGSFIDNLHVAHECKRGGVGSSLLKHVGAWLDPQYADLGNYLWVLEVNSSARRFYERVGGQNAGVSTKESHGGSVVRSCRYTWSRPALLAQL